PWRPRRATARQGVFIGGGIVVPIGALLPVAHRELPRFRAILLTRQQSLLLLILREMQEELEQDYTAVGECLLEGVDLAVARLPDAARHELMHPRHQH